MYRQNAFTQRQELQEYPFMLKLMQENPRLISLFVVVLTNFLRNYPSWSTKTFIEFLWSIWSTKEVEIKLKIDDTSLITNLLDVMKETHAEVMPLWSVPVCFTEIW